MFRSIRVPKPALLALLLLAAAPACTRSGGVPGKVAGTIDVSPALAAKLKPTDTLYVIARAQQVGPPSAVLRIEHPTFPLKYAIGAEHSMIPDMAKNDFNAGGNLTLAARISRTGNALPAAGDLEGVFAKNPAHPGDGGIDITIDKER
ncbi:MAG: hypothetical protein HY075_16325 [Deltaproteobacteria bacterium]|nr:hypothetical protein [Deltaproteobacteria bacterium]